MLLTLDGRLQQKTVLVLSTHGDQATLQLSGKSLPVTVQLTDILSCDYARGDHGEE